MALLGADLAPGVAQLTAPDGHLFTLYAGTPDDLADYRDVTLVPATPGLEAPNLALPVSTAYVECRWEDLFATTVAHLADHVPGQLWALDSNDVAWDARAIDPWRILL
ncbi:hypothetical protein [Kribbella italica]|uniref:Uncharacterized protein n=1 Tax=Kribbella italica TaxID=1540520 RepID=A0A7W9JFL1_9ACTN|nr:hypothetical protein [Kribbella italica]MBB5841252.1 hypothetical protein [Kribbella italica]